MPARLDDCAPLQTGEQLVALARQAGVRRNTVLLGGSSTPLDAAVAAGGVGWTFEFFVDIYVNTPEIGYTVVPTVAQVTGRPARTFAQWAREHAAA